MLGIEDSSQVVIGTVPEPDMAAIEAVDYESDKIRAMGNDKSGAECPPHLSQQYH